MPNAIRFFRSGIPLLTVLAFALVLGACRTTGVTSEGGVGLVDGDATRETRALYANLKRLAPDYVLFGHEDDLAYGVTWKREAGRSDVKDVTGAYPAVYGWEIGDLENGVPASLDDVNFDDMRQWIREAYARGGVNTISWHMDNPATGGNSWDTTRAVHLILPGGEKHEQYKQWLDRFADFALSLRAPGGELVPVIFRPFHEHTGGWFWWGKGHVTPDEYVRLWRFTVEYLRDMRGVHNLIYAYSTDVFDSEEQYLEHYPGDAYVDILGFDDYRDVRSDESVETLSNLLRMVVRMADARGKVAAFTETGLEGIPDEDFWTNRLLRAIKADADTRRIAYVLVWRNANEADNPGHFYAPYPGHPSADDFVAFYRDPFVLFGDELPDLYDMP